MYLTSTADSASQKSESQPLTSIPSRLSTTTVPAMTPSQVPTLTSLCRREGSSKGRKSRATIIGMPLPASAVPAAACGGGAGQLEGLADLEHAHVDARRGLGGMPHEEVGGSFARPRTAEANRPVGARWIGTATRGCRRASASAARSG